MPTTYLFYDLICDRVWQETILTNPCKGHSLLGGKAYLPSTVGSSDGVAVVEQAQASVGLQVTFITLDAYTPLR